MKQKIGFYITSALLVIPLFATVFVSQPALAFKCTGQTNNQQHYYKDGACYQPVGNTCLDNPPPATGEDCVNRDTTKDTKVADEKPVKNDGTAVTEWQCASGTYNASKNVCETCNAFGACQTNTRVSPTPKGQDTTVDPDDESQNGDDTENGGNGSTENGGEGECAGEKTDFLDCGDAEGGNALIAIIKIVILIVSVGIGIVAVGGIAFGAILYASAQDNQDQIRKSITIIKSVVVGLLLYIFMVGIINYLVPGGVFGSAEQEQCQTVDETANPDETPAECTDPEASNPDDENANPNNNQNNNNSNNNQQNNN